LKRKRFLYFFVGRSSFVNKDIEILSLSAEVVTFNFEVERSAKWKTVLLFFRQFFFLMSRGWSSQLVICQFAGYHSFLPVLYARVFKKKSLLVAGGTDCVSFPSIGYGNFYRPLLRFFTARSFELASHVAPKHETLWYCDYSYSRDDYPQQGIKHFLPQIKTTHTTIPNGYDEKKFFNTGVGKQNVFLTVTGAMEYSFQPVLKGIDLILQVAPHFPEYKFIVAGVLSKDQLGTVAANVELLPKIEHGKIIETYSSAKYYFQLSMAEGFPNALCEAMLCECVPIGSAVFSIPEIIDDTGFLLRHRDARELTGVIKKALTADTDLLGKKARERIIRNYPLSRRGERLNKLVEELTGKQGL
jgi:glycosyltransferase involved in cell wall biosynthesis